MYQYVQFMKMFYSFLNNIFTVIFGCYVASYKENLVLQQKLKKKQSSIFI